jgi:hypothetical protein
LSTLKNHKSHFEDVSGVGDLAFLRDINGHWSNLSSLLSRCKWTVQWRVSHLNEMIVISFVAFDKPLHRKVEENRTK